VGIVEAAVWTVSILATMGFFIWGCVYIYSLAVSLSRTVVCVGTALIVTIWLVIAVLWLKALGVV
jgi:hypothetical protein